MGIYDYYNQMQTVNSLFNITIKSICDYSACAYVLECRNQNNETIGFKVGSAYNFEDRLQDLTGATSQRKWCGGVCAKAWNSGVCYLIANTWLPVTCDNRTTARYDAYTLENELHKFFLERGYRQVAQDYFMLCDKCDEKFCPVI